MDFTKLDQNIDDYCEKESIMGVLRVTVRDRIVYEKNIGYADIETKKEFDNKSMFTFYSISKPFCILGIMKLVDKGLVDLDAHPSVYLPEAEWFDKRITLRMMFHHTSGLPDFREIPGTGEYAQISREAVRELKNLPMHFEPGTQGEYANVNILPAALII